MAMLHVYWAAGGQSGKLAAVPSVDGRPLFNPSPLGTLLVAAALVVAAVVVVGAMGWIASPVPASVFRALTYAIALVFVLRAVGDFRYVGFFKSEMESQFAYWDSLIYSPLCLGIAVGGVLVARWMR